MKITLVIKMGEPIQIAQPSYKRHVQNNPHHTNEDNDQYNTYTTHVVENTIKVLKLYPCVSEFPFIKGEIPFQSKQFLFYFFTI